MASDAKIVQSKIRGQAQKAYAKELLRRYRATGNPFILIEALLSGTKGEIAREAKKWLRGSLAIALGVAVGSKRGKPADIAGAFGINAKHIREAHSEFRDATIRRAVAGRNKKAETIDDAVSALTDGIPGLHGPVIRNVSNSTGARIAKSKPRYKW
ncbi:MAG: hypothetical protein J0H39_03880 [Alphaproteobacteria bacterium]|nr:hypothetical protein [Alphaproteobacteria bacterium]